MYTYSHRTAATALRWVGTIVHSFRGLSLWVSFAYMLLFFWRAFSRIKALKMVSRSLLGSLLWVICVGLFCGSLWHMNIYRSVWRFSFARPFCGSFLRLSFVGLFHGSLSWVSFAHIYRGLFLPYLSDLRSRICVGLFSHIKKSQFDCWISVVVLFLKRTSIEEIQGSIWRCVCVF